MVTPDKNVRHQQNLKNFTIAIVVLGNPHWPVLRHHVDRVVAAVNSAKPGSYFEVEILSYKGWLEWTKSDDVIAIIITIMVLEMKVPQGASFAVLRPLLPVFR